MRYTGLFAVALLLVAAMPAMAFHSEALQMREDYGAEPLYDTALEYYYYVPCPTYSWFWAYTGWDRWDIIGEWFQIGDVSMGQYGPADPTNCQMIDQIRVLDFAGYGTVRPGLFTVEFKVYCSDEYGCPIGPPLWNSGPKETGYAWNYFTIDPPLALCDCAVNPGPPGSAPRFLVTATHTGPEGIYPAWGMDNISTALETGCPMHDYGCLPALYPRPYNSHYTWVHSGFYGQDFQYCPPQWWTDGREPTPDGTLYGYLELCWRVYITCNGPSASQPATWGSIKSMYR